MAVKDLVDPNAWPKVVRRRYKAWMKHFDRIGGPLDPEERKRRSEAFAFRGDEPPVAKPTTTD